jgi:hypothetical protein
MRLKADTHLFKLEARSLFKRNAVSVHHEIQACPRNTVAKLPLPYQTDALKQNPLIIKYKSHPTQWHMGNSSTAMATTTVLRQTGRQHGITSTALSMDYCKKLTMPGNESFMASVASITKFEEDEGRRR